MFTYLKNKMARMYSRSKGKHGSKRPLNPSFSWVKYTQKEIEQLIIKMAKSEKTPAQIGFILRDSYGIPDIRKLAGKKVKKILEENKIKSKIPEELTALIKSEINLEKHLGKNKHDQVAKRGLILTESKIRRLAKYYKRNNMIPKDWVYNREQAKLLIA